MSNTHGSKWIRPLKRLRIYARDDYRCVLCTRPLNPSECTLGLTVKGEWRNVLSQSERDGWNDAALAVLATHGVSL